MSDRGYVVRSLAAEKVRQALSVPARARVGAGGATPVPGVNTRGTGSFMFV